MQGLHTSMAAPKAMAAKPATLHGDQYTLSHFLQGTRSQTQVVDGTGCGKAMTPYQRRWGNPSGGSDPQPVGCCLMLLLLQLPLAVGLSLGADPFHCLRCVKVQCKLASQCCKLYQDHIAKGLIAKSRWGSTRQDGIRVLMHRQAGCMQGRAEQGRAGQDVYAAGQGRMYAWQDRMYTQ